MVFNFCSLRFLSHMNPSFFWHPVWHLLENIKLMICFIKDSIFLYILSGAFCVKREGRPSFICFWVVLHLASCLFTLELIILADLI